MKIAMVTLLFPPIIAGSGKRFYEIGRRLSRKNEVHIYTVGVNGDAEEELDGMLVHRYGKFDALSAESAYRSGVKFSINLFNCLRKNDYDVIDCNIVSKMPAYVSYIIARRKYIPFIETWHEVMHVQNFHLLNPIMGLPAFFMEFPIPNLADMNIAVSDTTRRRMINLLNADAKKTVVISNGVDLEKFRKISVEKRYGRILYVGRLERHKRVDVLIHAYKILKRRYKDAELIIVGDGSQRRRLMNLSRHVDVRFYNFLPEEKLIAVMKSAWVLVLPSVKEGQGIVLLESMAAGTPPIAVQAEGSGVCDVIKNGYNGLLVSEEKIADAIQKLLSDGDMHASLRKNGMQFVKNYDWNSIAAKVAELYEKMR
ncbi:MAG: glycosyltransferase family 4 protein [Canidatus Methanoxibalbensis ujae]|nr:glycosyltransferase family 4 protein [Candidatus Methanoxibalbensis ujae]